MLNDVIVAEFDQYVGELLNVELTIIRRNIWINKRQFSIYMTLGDIKTQIKELIPGVESDFESEEGATLSDTMKVHELQGARVLMVKERPAGEMITAARK
jgi:hypothetical protein